MITFAARSLPTLFVFISTPHSGITMRGINNIAQSSGPSNCAGFACAHRGCQSNFMGARKWETAGDQMGPALMSGHARDPGLHPRSAPRAKVQWSFRLHHGKLASPAQVPDPQVLSLRPNPERP
jgi:hypothetical protein